MKSSSPKVSIITISYNQENYIETALESFISQEVNFPFEIIVADDGSKDKTQSIVRRFEEEHPRLFNNILRKKNVGAQQNFKEAILRAKGEYIALCEGDDFWTDTSKLQRQVDFLDENKEYALCFHPVRVFYEDGREKDYIYPSKTNRSMNLEGLIRENFIQTNSVMYRKVNYENLPTDILPLDWYLHLYHARLGKIGFIDRVMSAYRKHAGSMWWDAHNDINNLWVKKGLPHVAMYVEILKLFGANKAHAAFIYRHISNITNSFIEVDKQKNTHLLNLTVRNFPELTEPLLITKYETIHEKDVEIMELNNKTQELSESTAILEHRLEELNQELKLIKSSKIWKVRNIIAKVMRR